MQAAFSQIINLWICVGRRLDSGKLCGRNRDSPRVSTCAPVRFAAGFVSCPPVIPASVRRCRTRGGGEEALISLRTKGRRVGGGGRGRRRRCCGLRFRRGGSSSSSHSGGAGVAAGHGNLWPACCLSAGCNQGSGSLFPNAAPNFPPKVILCLSPALSRRFSPSLFHKSPRVRSADSVVVIYR